MAAVVRDALRRVAPTVSLYVNDYNTVARRVYDRCGFRRSARSRRYCSDALIRPTNGLFLMY